MKKIRIGNDIYVAWQIFGQDGVPYNLVGKSLVLDMRVHNPESSTGETVIPVTNFSVTYNTLYFTFWGVNQTLQGLYILKLRENIEGGGQKTLDTKEAFTLVGHSWDQSDDDSGLLISMTSFVGVGLRGEKGDKGDKGDQGDKGDTGDPGIETASVTVDATTGSPSVIATITNKNLALSFSGIKGEQGIQGIQGVQGPKGDQGNTGSSVDYPYELVNNLTTDDPTKGLTAAMGKQIGDSISQLGQEINGTPKNYTADVYLKNDGTMAPNVGWGVTDLIPYTQGQPVTWKFDSVIHSYYIGFYNAGKEYISGSDFSAQYNAQVGGRLLTAAQVNQYARNAAYIRASFTLGYADAEILVGDTSVWTPQGGTQSLQGQIDELSDTVGGLASETAESIKIIPQSLTPEQQENARTNVGVDDVLKGVKQNYISNARVQEGAIFSEDGWYVTDFIPCEPGDAIVWNFGGGAGTSARSLCLYDENKDYANFYSSNGYTDTRTMTLASGSTFKYIRATFKKTFADGTPNLTPVIVNDVAFHYMDGVTSFFDYVKDNLYEEKRWKPLCIPGLINSDCNADGDLQDSDFYTPRRVTTSSVVTPPFPGATIRFRFNRDVPFVLSIFFYSGNSAGSKSYDAVIGRMMDGDIRTFADSTRCIRPVFRASNKKTAYDVEISANDVNRWFADGSLALEYYDVSPYNVVERNAGILANLSALKRMLIPSVMADNGMDSMPVIGHITDLHGDAQRFRNFMDFCENTGVDLAINSGDSALFRGDRDSSKFVPDIAKEHNIPLLFAIGNHESFPTGIQSLFADNVSELAQEYEYLASSGTITEKCYYYKDFPGKNLRVIALNQYEDGVYRLRLGQAQVSWFIDTLLSTPAGYGIVITYHAPEDRVEANAPYDVFRQPEPNGSSSHPNGYYVDKRAIELIVDAFISRTHVNFTYEDHSSTYNGTSDVTTETVSVVADFSGIDETTEFICYVAGHKHEDWIGFYSNSENRQLYLGITCGNALYGDSSNPAWSNQSDLPRGGVGVSQDAFCIYAIDRLNGNVKVMRVGATVTQMMVKREMMVIPYKD